MACLGYKDPNDPRMRGTYDLIRKRLGRNGLLYRYEPDIDCLPSGEGAFGICSFWAVDYLVVSRRRRRRAANVRARDLIGERPRSVRRGDRSGRRQSVGQLPPGFHPCGRDLRRLVSRTAPNAARRTIDDARAAATPGALGIDRDGSNDDDLCGQPGAGAVAPESAVPRRHDVHGGSQPGNDRRIHRVRDRWLAVRPALLRIVREHPQGQLVARRRARVPARVVSSRLCPAACWRTCIRGLHPSTTVRPAAFGWSRRASWASTTDAPRRSRPCSPKRSMD